LDFSPKFASVLKMDNKHDTIESPNRLTTTSMSNLSEIAGHSSSSTFNDVIKFPVSYLIIFKNPTLGYKNGVFLMLKTFKMGCFMKCIYFYQI
jgi:hypothetical protein